MKLRVVVEWTRGSARLALCEHRGRQVRLRSFRQEPLGPDADARPVLRRLIGASAGRKAALVGVIPRESVLTRVVAFPTVVASELASMVELYAKSQLPYPREETIIGFEPVRREGGQTTVLLVAAQREVIERHVAVLREAGLPVETLTLSSSGVAAWAALAQQRGLLAQVPDPMLVVNVDDTRTDLVVVEAGRVLSARSLGQGAQDWGTGTDVTALLAQEIDRSRTALRKELSDTDVRAVVLTGVEAAASWAQALGARVDVAVHAANAAQSFVPQMMPGASISPVVVGGLASQSSARWMDLSPPEHRTRQRHHSQLRELVTAGGLLLAALIIGGSVLALRIGRDRRLAHQLDAVLQEAEPAATAAQRRARTARLVAGVVEDRRHLAGLFAAIFRETAQPLALESVAFERVRGEVVVRGFGPSTQAVLEYVQRLQALEDVARVQLKYSTRRAGASGTRTDFELSVWPTKAGAA